MSHEHTSPTMASLASRAMRNPEALTPNEIRSLAACVLTQARNHKPEPAPEVVEVAPVEAADPTPEPVVEAPAEKKGIFARLFGLG